MTQLADCPAWCRTWDFRGSLWRHVLPQRISLVRGKLSYLGARGVGIEALPRSLRNHGCFWESWEAPSPDATPQVSMPQAPVLCSLAPPSGKP